MIRIDYSGFDFEKDSKPIAETLAEALMLVEKLPHSMQVVIDSSSRDAEGGYGWHRNYHLAIYELGERCKKCGSSTFDAKQSDNFLSRIQHHHDWIQDERLLYIATFSQIGCNNKWELQKLDEFVKYTIEQAKGGE